MTPSSRFGANLRGGKSEFVVPGVSAHGGGCPGLLPALNSTTVRTPWKSGGETAMVMRTPSVGLPEPVFRGMYASGKGWSLADAVRHEFRTRAEPHVVDGHGSAPNLSRSAARDLAAFVLSHLDELAFPIDVEEIARQLGVQRLLLDPHLKDAAGGLVFRDSKLTIVYGTENRELMRETIAHELGHFLLRITADLPFKNQIGDPAVERFCDGFARELLVPSGWLQALTPRSASIDVALEVSELTGSSLPTAATALLDAHGKWPGFLLIWATRKDHPRSWLVSHCISKSPASYRSDASTVAALEAASCEPRRIGFTVVRNGRLCDATADVVRVGESVATWVHHLKPVTDSMVSREFECPIKGLSEGHAQVSRRAVVVSRPVDATGLPRRGIG